MSLILSIDTTAEIGSVGLLGDSVAAEMPIHAPEGFGGLLFDAIAKLLKAHQVELRQITRFAAAAGPGSFTGVRVGLAAAKGLAEVSGRPIVPVSNLKALASLGSRARRAVLIDARRGEIFGAVYSGQLEVMSPEMVARLPKWLELIAPYAAMEFIAQDFTPFAETLPPCSVRTLAPRALALAIARLAREADPEDPAGVDANYVRRSDAELFWKDRI